MSDNWMGPFLSGANNLEFAGSFEIDLNEVKHFKSLDIDQQDSYKFKGENNLVHYNHNPIGYVYLIKIATIVFPFLGDQLAVILLQCMVYVLINLLFLNLNTFNKRQRWLFFILFSINPIVLKFIPFNFYYFWQIIPTALFGYVLLASKPRRAFVIPLIILLPFILLTRPTVIVSLLFVFYVLYKQFNYSFSLRCLLFTFLVSYMLYQPTKKNVWHTVYAGLGAYQNEYGIKLSDKAPYNLYERITGEKLVASVGGNYYEEEVIDKYTVITKEEVIKIFKENPYIFIKNAFINTLQGFSFGYFNRNIDYINYFISFIGFIFLVFLYYNKLYTWIIFILFTVGTFTIYYPPIPAYMFGNYLPIVLSLTLIKRIKKNNLINSYRKSFSNKKIKGKY
ncbi:MAG: hypothetical protein GKR88_06875 [Flavobacteriaceae bacterium]|nr:MAG: hypothetical protein GKR88_06875 [Flavobacteriaceae bacterium]